MLKDPAIIHVSGKNVHIAAVRLIEEGVAFRYSSKRREIRFMLHNGGRANRLELMCRSIGCTTRRANEKIY